MHIGAKIVNIRNDAKNPKAKFYGRRFFINGKFITILRCRICGKEYQYEGLKKPVHCGSDACTEWWRLHFKHMMMTNDIVRDKEFFGRKAVVEKICNNSKNYREAEDNMRLFKIKPEQMKKKAERRRMTFATFSLKGQAVGTI